jgi:hypothetical protein
MVLQFFQMDTDYFPSIIRCFGFYPQHIIWYPRLANTSNKKRMKLFLNAGGFTEGDREEQYA